MAGTKREPINPLASAQQRMAQSTLGLINKQLGDAGIKSVVEADGTLVVGNYKLTSVGLIDNGATADEWEHLGIYFSNVNKAWVWLVADWLISGERVHGKSYDEAAEIIRKSIGTLYNWGSVAKRVEISRRREKLDFTHHVAVAPLEPEWQVYWLDWAERQQWSKRRLEAMIQEYPDGIPNGVLPGPAPSVPDLTPGGELPLVSKKERRVFNKAVRLARIMSQNDLKKMDSKQQQEMLEAARQFERLAAEIKRAVKGG
jgi:hypothetical protein